MLLRQITRRLHSTLLQFNPTRMSNSNIPSKMRAVLQSGNGGPEVLYVGETDVPQLKQNEVLVQVYTTALNRAETLQRQGNYPIPRMFNSIYIYIYICK